MTILRIAVKKEKELKSDDFNFKIHDRFSRVNAGT